MSVGEQESRSDCDDRGGCAALASRHEPAEEGIHPRGCRLPDDLLPARGVAAVPRSTSRVSAVWRIWKHPKNISTRRRYGAITTAFIIAAPKRSRHDMTHSFIIRVTHLSIYFVN